ncbi:MAG: chromate efflux transporter [Opitutaceae bacterium]|nr:chromate efflux transporter [Opitutaceae bacterium]
MSSHPTLREALRFWLKLGFISFGGPAGQIAVMHRELVERKRWIDEPRFLHALNFCMLLPGPEATQLATYCGWLLHGVRGGLIAGVLFVVPGVLTLGLLSWIYVRYGTVPEVAAIFHGLKAAVLAIVVAAVWRVGRRALTGSVAWVLAAAAFVALFFLKLSFPVVVFGALLLGFWGGRWRPGIFGGGTAPLADTGRGAAVPARRTLKLAGMGIAVWFAPVLLAGVGQGWDSTLTQIGWFFSKAAVVTFGGAYAVLPYVGQQAVEHYHWISAGQMLDGLAFAETTPGPLILVLQFVGFLAGWQHAGGLAPWLSAMLGAGLTVWVTFVPTYLFILIGAPYVERVRGDVRLSAALAAVTAAVVGVIFNLALWFALQVVFPAQAPVDWFAFAVGVAAFVALERFKWEIVPVVLASGALGWGWMLLTT